jgi:NADPH-dependent glutamate synthase beta subunit-like oxidoreductase/2,4-dienoyl-CoA reductase-like NADH-dependent reductase (Old Yellow Enzyme family)
MSKHSKFKFKDKDALLKMIEELGVNIPFSDDVHVLLEKVDIANKRTANRFAVHPMEGFDADTVGTPGELAFRRYNRYAAGGSGLIWFEATAVAKEGRSNPSQFYISKNNMDTYKRLVESTRKTAAEEFGTDHELILILQLTHSGRYSKPTLKPKPVIAHHSLVLDPIHNLSSEYPLITDNELDNLQEIFVESAQLAADAGFDGVDIKACHRYLVSELLASFTREDSKYGGSFENRTRFLLETANNIKENVNGIFVTSRLNVFDGIKYPFGFGVDKNDQMKADLEEPKILIKKLIQIGYPVLNLSIGNPYFNPHIGRPFDSPVVGMKPPEEHPLVGVSRFLSIIGELQSEFPDFPIVGTGYSWLRHFFPNVAAAVVKSGKATIIGQGRGAFAYPDSVRDIVKHGAMDPHKTCVTCSGCTQIMRDGGRTGCVIRDKEIYSVEYRKMRSRAPDVLKKEAERCRDCDSPMCQLACPAGLDIPKFIKAYADGDIEKAYSIITEKNVFPEMCALICPVEVQCQGACLENILNNAPVMVSEIQRTIAVRAQDMGISTIRVPKHSLGKKVAVIGAGPAGIACAAKLLKMGYKVEVFEKSSTIGGVPNTIIPFQRIDSKIVFNEAKNLLIEAKEKNRLEIHQNFPLNEQNNLKTLNNKFDAVFLGFGLSTSMVLPGVSSRPDGIEDALSFLQRTKTKSDLSVGKKVAVLGGGNTAIDAAVVAKTNGAQDVFIIYRRSFVEMPAWPKERNEALEQGIHFLILSQPLDYIAENGRLVGLKIARTELGEPDGSGRRRPQIIPNSEFVFSVDHVIEAIGQRIDEETKRALGSLDLNKNGWIKVDDNFKTSITDVFAGGDIINGGTTAVQAIADGMKAAVEIDKNFKT